MKKGIISIVIPVYRNESTLSPTYDSIKAALQRFSKKFNYEFIFINDGSDDNSLAELLTIKKHDKRVTIISFIRNFGQVSAIYAGFAHARGEALITISADMQDPPCLIDEMIKKWQEGYMVVACARVDREDTILSRVSSKIFYRLIKVSMPAMPNGGFDFFLLDQKVYKEIESLNEKNSFVQGAILWLGYKPYFIPYKRMRRRIGRSQWTSGKKIKYLIDGLITTSYLPIRVMSFMGILTSFVGFLYAIVVILARILNQTPFKGYTPIMVVLLIVSGLIMTMLGIIGEYLWRIYDEIRKRPKYIIKDIL